MNWVAPIKDDTTLEKFKQKLREVDDKYYILFEIGVGTGLQLQEILKFRNKDIRDKDSIEASIGTKNIKRTFQIPQELKEIISQYTEGKDPEAYLILGHSGSPAPLSREQAYRVFKNVGKSMGLNAIGAQTMRKTFAWRYYKETNDIYYIQNLLNHASPSITYRYIGEKPNVEVVLKKMTPEENERSRYMLYKDNAGKNRIHALTEELIHIERELDNPTNNDAFYGRVDCLLAELEELMEGILELDGKPINDVEPKDREIAMVFQYYSLYKNMTVYDNLSFGMKLKKCSTEQIEAAVKEAADMLGLEELLNRRLKILSEGQKKRVALGRAIIRKPKLFLFDEPLNGLDEKVQVQIRTEIEKLHERYGTTILYAAHDKDEAKKFDAENNRILLF